MANEVTTQTASSGELVPVVLSELVIDAAYAASVARPLCRIDSLVGRPGKVLDIPVWPKLSAGALTEGSDASNTAVNTTKVTLTAAEVGIMVTVTDLLEEADIIAGLGDFARQLGMAVAEKIDADVTALFTGFSGSTGSTGADLTEALWLDAIYKLENANAPRPYVCVLHPRQTHALRKALAASTGVIHEPGSPASDFAKYVDQAGYFGTLFGVPIFATTTCPSINSATDFAGGMMANQAALGFLEKWGIRTEMFRDISLRATEIVSTTAYAVGELVDAYGIEIISKQAL